MNLQQAAAFALANGAELTVDGRTINKGRERFSLVKRDPDTLDSEAPPPPPQPPASDALTAQLASLAKSVEILAAAVKPAQAEPAQEEEQGMSLAEISAMPMPRRPVYDFRVMRDDGGGMSSVLVLRDGLPRYTSTFEADPKTGLIDRFSLTPLPGSEA